MSAFRQALTKFKANLITSLAVSITVPESTTIYEPLFDMFEEVSPRAPWKRPMEVIDVEKGHKWQKTSEEDKELEEQITEFILQRSREEEELRKAQELERYQGVGSTGTTIA